MDHKKRSLLLVLCMVLATAQACAPTLIPPPTLIPLQKEELAQLKDQPEIHAIHYARPAPEGATRGSGGNIIPMYQFGPQGAAAGILAQIALKALAAGVQSATAATGPPEVYCWDDPVLQVKDRFLVSLEAELGLKQNRVVQDPREDDDLEGLQAEFGSATIIDFKTIHCELAVGESERSQVQEEDLPEVEEELVEMEPGLETGAGPAMPEANQVVAYAARSRLIRLEDPKIVWQGVCRFPEEEETIPVQEESLEADSEIPRPSTTKEAVDNCAKQLLAQFFGKESPAR